MTPSSLQRSIPGLQFVRRSSVLVDRLTRGRRVDYRILFFFAVSTTVGKMVFSYMLVLVGCMGPQLLWNELFSQLFEEYLAELERK